MRSSLKHTKKIVKQKFGIFLSQEWQSGAAAKGKNNTFLRIIGIIRDTFGIDFLKVSVMFCFKIEQHVNIDHYVPFIYYQSLIGTYKSLERWEGLQ